MEKMDKVLLLEPNAYHYEVIPGFAYYFCELGYEVDCLVQKHETFGNEFCLCNDLEARVNIIIYNNNEMTQTVEKLTSQNKYEFIFLTSLDYIENGCLTSIYNIIKRVDNSKHGIIGCYHALSSYVYNKKDELINPDRIVSLSSIKTDDIEFSVVNSNYFTDNIRFKEKNKCLSLVSIGVSNDGNEMRNALNQVYQTDNILINVDFIGGKTAKELSKSQLKKRLAYPIIVLLGLKKFKNEGYAPFPKIKKQVRDKICMHGKIHFEDMFQVIDNADFILINIADRFSNEFSKNKTSGSKQLSIGFCRPCIIEKKYADYYGFSEKNAIIYEHGQLADAISRAAKLPSSEYEIMQQELFELQKMVRTQSIVNLKTLIDKIL